jgi:uncharacterized protein
MISTEEQTQLSQGKHSEANKNKLRLTRKKIWIDLDNSPHVPFFLPIMEGLEKAGYRVYLTGRDSYQVCELLRLHHLPCRVVGKHYGKSQVLKFLGTGLRAMQLLPLAIKEKPDLAISHGSRAQFLAGSLLRIPTVVMIDYEFTGGTGFLNPDWLFAPEVIPAERLSLKADHVFRYGGLKEDVYVQRLKPDPGFRNQLGVREDEIVVTARPPATEAHYHNPEGEEFFAASLRFLLAQSRARVVMLPRNERQATILRASWTRAIDEGRVIIPACAVDGLNLIWNSDLVISGGGTMNREAAALGVPVYSVFRGRLGAVDQYLANAGRLTVIEDLTEIPRKIILERRAAAQFESRSHSVALDSILQAIISIAEDKCLPPHH